MEAEFMRTFFQVKSVELDENGNLKKVEFYDTMLLTPSDVAQFISYIERDLKAYRGIDKEREESKKQS